jgi:hypothetical protein
MTTQLHTGRVNQKQRTRTAIVRAAREQMVSGAEVSMPLVATAVHAARTLTIAAVATMRGDSSDER